MSHKHNTKKQSIVKALTEKKSACEKSQQMTNKA
jgi:hypothetical protein